MPIRLLLGFDFIGLSFLQVFRTILLRFLWLPDDTPVETEANCAVWIVEIMWLRLVVLSNFADFFREAKFIGDCRIFFLANLCCSLGASPAIMALADLCNFFRGLMVFFVPG